MAEKGVKAKLYDVAMRMYIDGQSLTEIESMIEVSRQTLSVWKADTKKPGEDLDEWDRAREQKRGAARRLEALLDREMGHAESQPAGQVSPAAWDSISKLGALVQRFQASEREAALKSSVQRAALFLDFVRDLISFFAGRDPAMVAALEEHFDDLIQWGREKYGGDA